MKFQENANPNYFLSKSDQRYCLPTGHEDFLEEKRANVMERAFQLLKASKMEQLNLFLLKCTFRPKRWIGNILGGGILSELYGKYT